jgi:hypothetical protein
MKMGSWNVCRDKLPQVMQRSAAAAWPDTNRCSRFHGGGPPTRFRASGAANLASNGEREILNVKIVVYGPHARRHLGSDADCFALIFVRDEAK